MTDGGPHPFKALIARLAAEAEWRFLANPDAGVLVWDRSGERLLWASPSAAGLREAFADEAGHVLPDFRARERIRTLAGGEAPWQGLRQERLRLDPTRPWLPVACACRMASLDDGDTVLVTALSGPMPKVGSRPRTLRQAVEAPSLDEPRRDASAEPALRQAGPIRFIWHTDAQTRFTDVSPDLAQAVGAMAGNIVGLTWDELSRSRVEDPDGAVAALFANRDDRKRADGSLEHRSIADAGARGLGRNAGFRREPRTGRLPGLRSPAHGRPAGADIARAAFERFRTFGRFRGIPRRT